jgi:ABC-type uncharacterized transport system auxiliary subunit
MLNTNIEISATEESRYKEKVLRVGQMESSALLGGRSIYYEVENGRSYSYTKARWLESVPQQLTNLIMISLTKTEIFKDVIPYRSLAKNDLILETSLYTFTQTIHEDGNSTLKVAMKVRLVEQYNRKIIANRLFELKKEGVKGNSEGATDGYLELSEELLREINRWLKESCKP